MSWQMAPLGEVLAPIQTWNPKRAAAADVFDYIDLSSVDRDEKAVMAATPTITSEAPSRARQLVKSGDILVSTVRPNLNAVAVVDEDLDGATASTGFSVLRPDDEKAASRFIYHWVRTPSFVADMVRKATGASYPAVSDKIVAESLIPLPPLEEQRRIAGILDAADALRRRRREALALLDTLPGAIFAEMFGDPSTNPHGYEPGAIGDLLDDVRYGTSNKAGADGALPILRMGNLTYQGRMDLGDLKRIDLSEKDIPKHTVRKGDILFNRTNSADLVGKTAIFKEDEPYAFAGYLVRARVSNGNRPEYVAGYLNSPHGKKVLRNMAKNIVGMANINAKEMQTIPILLAPEDKQESYAKRCAQIDERREILMGHFSQLETLFASLQSRAFAGAL
jgi:type I restriction enzyme S subunit